MLLDQLNLNHVRIFETVYRTRSMTDAAAELHLTQSGVSQHMKALEDVLEVKLFDRINQRLVPTPMAHSFYEKSKMALADLEQALWSLKGGNTELKGRVGIGMPIEFGVNLVMPLLSEFSHKHPFVNFQLRMGFASEMNERLLTGDIDFAFVDDFKMDTRVETVPVFDEVLELCIQPALLAKFGKVENSKKFFETLPYVDYQLGEPLTRMWMKHHLSAENISLSTKAIVMDVQAVARLVKTGMGASVLPKYLVDRLIQTGNEIFVFEGSKKPLKNSISMAFVHQRTQSGAVVELMKVMKDFFSKAKP